MTIQNRAVHLILALIKWLGLFSIAAIVAIAVVPPGLMPLPFGYKLYIVQSGSMEPTIPTGCVVLTRSLNGTPPKIGEIITFRHPSFPDRELAVTHRVVGVEEKGEITTQGDSNETSDNWVVTQGMVLGRVLGYVPFLGFVANSVKTPVGFVVAVALPAFLIILDEIRKIRKALEKEYEKKLKAKLNEVERKVKKAEDEIIDEIKKEESLIKKTRGRPKKKRGGAKPRETMVSVLIVCLTLLYSGVYSLQFPVTFAVFSDQKAISGSQVSTGWWVEPSIAVTSPNGAEKWPVGTGQTITWSAIASDPAASVFIDIYFSPDGGATYPTTVAFNIANTGSYPWTPPSPATEQGRIKVVATDSHGLSKDDASAGIFSTDEVVINEIYPDEDWVELFNKADLEVDTQGWVLLDQDGDQLLITADKTSGNTVIASKGYLVVEDKGDLEFDLKSSGKVTLISGPFSGAVTIDEYNYEGENGKSIARLPDGEGNWVITCPSKNSANQTCPEISPSPDPDVSGSDVPLPSPSLSPVPSEATASATPSASPQPSDAPGEDEPEPSPSAEPSTTLQPEESPSESPQSSPTASPDPSESPAASPSPVVEATPEPSASPAEQSPSPSPTDPATPNPEPTPPPSSVPEPTPDPTPTEEPSSPPDSSPSSNESPDEGNNSPGEEGEEDPASEGGSPIDEAQ